MDVFARVRSWFNEGMSTSGEHQMAGSKTLPLSASMHEDKKNEGNEHLRLGEWSKAIQCYQEAIRLMPSYAEAYANMGYVFRLQNHHMAAYYMLTKAAALKPELWEACLNLGGLESDLGCYEDAVKYYQRVLAIYNSNPARIKTISEVYAQLGNALVMLERYEEALVIMRRWSEENSEQVEAHCNVGVVLQKLGRYEEALVQFEKAVKLAPQHTIAARFLGIIYQELQNWTLALQYYDRACQLDHENTDALLDAALLLLLLGDYEQGWPKYEQALPYMRSRLGQVTEAHYFRALFTPEKYWSGDPLNQKILVIWTEQGFGDSLMMLRYVQPIKLQLQPEKILVICDQQLVRLVEDIPEIDQVIVKSLEGDGALLQRYRDLQFDRHCSIMSLPFLMKTCLDTIPDCVPYVAVKEAEQQRWAERLTDVSGLKVGLVWGGNASLVKDKQRSILLEKFEPLINIDGVSWISLQKGDAATQLTALNWPVIDWVEDLNDMQDTAALIKNLDLVITVDTSVVHLAGALGQPAWLLCRSGSEWRWLLDREDSPWYPTVRIFRQTARDDWSSVLTDVQHALQALISSRDCTNDH